MAEDEESGAEAMARLARAGFDEELVLDGSRLRVAGTGEGREPADLAVAAVVDVHADSAGEQVDEATVFAVTTAAGEAVGTFVAPRHPEGDARAVVEALRRPPISPEEVRAHREHDHIVAVFPGREDAEAAVADLRALGLGSEHLGVAVRGPVPVAFEHDEDADAARDVAVDATGGAVAGFLAGFALFGLAVPIVGTVGVGGLLALGAASGFGGAMLGGYLGVAHEQEALTAHDQIASTPLGPGEVLVAVCSHGHAEETRAVLQRNGGRFPSVRAD